MDLQDFPVANLVLDERNPRFAEPTKSSRESINALLADAPAKLVALAQDIAREGLNPTELPVVVEQDGRHVVIEGNRRVAALKLLNNPDLADQERLCRQFREAAKAGNPPIQITCVLAESREAARHWLRLRHTGENGGVGIVAWNTEQQNTFIRRRGSQADRAIMFCNAIVSRYAEAADLLADVEKVRRERLTTLGRLVVDPEVRSAIGFDFEDDTVIFNFPDDSILTAAERLFSDLSGDLSVSKVKSKAQRQEYLGKIENHLPPRSKRLPKPNTVSSPRPPREEPEAEPDGQSRETTKPTTATPRRRDPQERYIFQGLRLRHFHLRTSDVLAEAQKIEIDRSPNVAAIMLRVVIDVAVTDAASILDWKKSQNELKERITAILRKLDPPNEDVELIDARRHSEGAGLLGIKTLHGFIHHWATHPTTTDIRKISLAFRPMLEKLDTYLAENKKS